MKRKKIYAAVAVALCISLNTLPVFAAEQQNPEFKANVNEDGTEVTDPGYGRYGWNDDAEQTAGESYNFATMTSTDGAEFYTENDDDDLAKAVDTGGADINVWARVTDNSSKIYKVDIAWGSMKFEFSDGGSAWNTETHAYEGLAGVDNEADALWINEGGVGADASNNKITVTNHSNNAVDASFVYTMSILEGGMSLFNGTPTADDAVLGTFWSENGLAVTASEKLLATYAAGEPIYFGDLYDQDTDKAFISLPTAEAFKDDASSGAREDAVFFVFSGTPDAERGDPLSNFTKVGIITVTIEPNMDPDLNAIVSP